MTQTRMWRSKVMLALITCWVVMAGTVVETAQRPGPGRPTPDVLFPSDPVENMPRKRKQELLKHYLKNMREDAAEMSRLASSIHEDLEKTTENELPLRVVEKAEKVEKLAKRIKNTAKGF